MFNHWSLRKRIVVSLVAAALVPVLLVLLVAPGVWGYIHGLAGLHTTASWLVPEKRLGVALANRHDMQRLAAVDAEGRFARHRQASRVALQDALATHHRVLSASDPARLPVARRALLDLNERISALEEEVTGFEKAPVPASLIARYRELQQEHFSLRRKLLHSIQLEAVELEKNASAAMERILIQLREMRFLVVEALLRGRLDAATALELRERQRLLQEHLDLLRDRMQNTDGFQGMAGMYDEFLHTLATAGGAKIQKVMLRQAVPGVLRDGTADMDLLRARVPGISGLSAMDWYMLEAERLDALGKISMRPIEELGKPKLLESVLETIGLYLAVLFLALFLILAALVIGRRIARHMIRQIDDINRSLRETARTGDLRIVPEVHDDHELGHIAAAVRDQQQYLRELAAKVRRVAHGDFSIEVTSRGERDDLGNALADLVKSFHVLSRRLRQIAEGDIDQVVAVRGRHDVIGHALVNLVSQLELHRAQSEEQARLRNAREEELARHGKEVEQQRKVLSELNQRLILNEEALQASNTELSEMGEHLSRSNAELYKARALADERAELAESANRTKSEFIANISHELRTPLNAMLVLSRLLSTNESGNLSEEDVQTARMIHESGGSLLRLINEILDLSRVEAGRIEIHPEPTRPREIGEQLQRRYRKLAEEKGLALELYCPAQLNMPVLLDEHRVQQVLGNLVGNAIKFSEGGTVDVIVDETTDPPPFEAENPVTRWLQFAVRDSGIGLTEEQQGKIFEPFTQADGAMIRQYEGSGLGLTIARRLARMMEGDIHVHSMPGEGSCFTFWVPLREATEEATLNAHARATLPQTETETHTEPAGEALPSARALAGKVVLLVDDDMRNLFTLSKLLGRCGIEVRKAADGEKALSLLREEIGGVDLVLTDIQMPKMDGLELTRTIRSEPQLVGLPVIACTARAMGDDEAQCLEAGANAYISKPVDPARLIHLLDEVMSSPSASVA